LLGQIINTNAKWISERLAEIGVDVYYHVTVGDNKGRLRAAVEAAMQRADCILVTGGLGPTADDITRETVAELLGRELREDACVLASIQRRFAARGRVMTPNNRKQALLLEGAKVIENPNGTAPGQIIEHGGHSIVLLPGPPSELQPMFTRCIMPYLCERMGQRAVIVSRVVRICGPGESVVEEKVKDLLAGENPTVAPYASLGEVQLRVTAKAHDRAAASQLIEGTVHEICCRLGGDVYGFDNEDLVSVCSRLLTEKGLTLAIAESCTGGLLASRLTSIAGASSFFFGCVVAYDNSAKRDILGVPASVLESFGAVSAECAVLMAQQARARLMTDIGIAITGISGPEGGTANKPVGTTFIALCAPEGTLVVKDRFLGERNQNREWAVVRALDTLRRYLTLQEIPGRLSNVWQ